jgi:hypothetical protein
MPKELNIPQAPPDRGQLWFDDEIPKQFLKDLPGIKHKPEWVRRNFPKDKRIKIGQRSAWYESDIRAHLDSLRGKVAA